MVSFKAPESNDFKVGPVSPNTLILSTAVFFHTFTDGIGHQIEYLFGDIADYHRTLFHIRRYISPETFIANMLLAADPEFDFGAQVGDIIVVYNIENDRRAVGQGMRLHHRLACL